MDRDRPWWLTWDWFSPHIWGQTRQAWLEARRENPPRGWHYIPPGAEYDQNEGTKP